MRPDRAGLLLVIAVVAAAIVAGLWQTGGPWQGAAERRDKARHDDLLALQGQARCLSRAAGDKLPPTLAATDGCNRARRYEDPASGVPYRYEVLGPDTFRLCASFEFPARARFRDQDFDPDTGCITATLDRRRP